MPHTHGRPQAEVTGQLPPPTKNVKAGFASTTTFWFAQKKNQDRCHQAQAQNIAKMRLWPGSALPDPLAGFKGYIIGGGKERGKHGRGRVPEEGRGNGRGGLCP